MDKTELHNWYNATSTDNGKGDDELESYEEWLERQLISRIERIKSLSDGLDDAITGLEWWMSNYPEGIGKVDEDKISELKQIQVN